LEWNSWTEVNDLNVGRALAGAGTNTAALGFGGNTILLQAQPKNGTLQQEELGRLVVR
jgi:hypothetical protein